MISISGIGPKLALTILSGITTEILKNSIIAGDVPSLTRVPGVGAKTAKRIIVELKEKFISIESDTLGIAEEKQFSSHFQDVLNALLALGYKDKHAKQVCKELEKDGYMEGKLETIIKLALGKINVMINFNKQLDKLGTETAFSVSAEANSWKDKGHKVYPFHLGDLNFQTPSNIREKTVFYMNKNKNGYCPSEGVPELRQALAKDVGEKEKQYMILIM